MLALGSGFGMACPFVVPHTWFLGWLALAPLWILALEDFSLPVLGHRSPDPPTQINPYLELEEHTISRSVRTRSFPFAIFFALVWGIGCHGLSLFWIRDLHPLTWMGVPWATSVVIMLLCWILVTLYGAAIAITWTLLFRFILQWISRFKSFSKSFISPSSESILLILFRILIGTTLWCLLEALWSFSPLWWTSLSVTQSPDNLLALHLGQISGPTTLTAALVAVNGLLAEAWRHRQAMRQWCIGGAVAVFAIAHLLGFVLYAQPLLDSPQSAFTIGIVQGNVPTRIKLFEEGTQLALERYTQGYLTLADQGVDAVLTPEGAFPWLWLRRPRQDRNEFYQAIRSRGIPAWVGTVGMRGEGITQTLFSLAGDGAIVGEYDKIKLVPLGEYIPFQEVLGQFINRLSPVEASMIPGQPHQRMETPVGRAIAAICFDSAFSWLFRDQAAAGGAFIITASNNDPYGAMMMAQHHAQDVMRAVESDRWTVRATNTGFSGVVDPHGQTQWRSGFRTYETHAHRIHRRNTKTLYVRWGDWLLPVLVVTTLCLGLCILNPTQ